MQSLIELFGIGLFNDLYGPCLPMLNSMLYAIFVVARQNKKVETVSLPTGQIDIISFSRTIILLKLK